MATRLKRLDLLGFKSFATPTTFVFDSGITAIIGPNGSGKSNIADALRWVLGEQSYANLRGRRTEDVIFAGSASRTPIGMAEVTLTLDNEAGDLPVAFREVSITRRAYRSGENQYLINGSRVRLKDVAQLTASLGQAHTVIGQGLVDAVLSQRAEERRSLFEHAAGITGLRLKYAEAARSLEESRANSARLEDLLADIEPRLRVLERAAQQAREYGQVRERLRESLQRWYAGQWREAGCRLEEAEAAVERVVARVAAAEAERAEATTAWAAAEREAAAQREADERLSAVIGQRRGERQRAEHTLALLRERRTATGKRQEDLERALADLQRATEAASAEAADLRARLADVLGTIGGREREAGELEQRVAAARAERAEHEQRLRSRERERAEAERALVATEGRLASIASQEQELAARLERVATARSERERRANELTVRREQAAKAREEAEREVGRLSDERERLDAEMTALTTERDRLHEEERRLQRRLVELSTRLETLTRLHESGAGLFAGVKAVLDGARSGRLQGVVGPLASLLDVPTELEAAIEVALGGHLQDVVVEHWADAERAIDHLKQTRAGRATFQPLDTVRAGRSNTPRYRATGVRGVAAELIGYDPRVEAVVAGLLGRVLVAEDLAATRAVLGELPAGWSVVTLGGDIARSSGTVTGGARVKESGTLARERELRELPEQQAGAERALAARRAEQERHDEGSRSLREARTNLDRALAEAREVKRAAVDADERAARQLAELARAAREELERRRESEARRATLAVELERLSSEQAERRDAIALAVADIETMAAELEQRPDADEARLQELRAELSGLRERRRGIEADQARLRAQRESAARQRAELVGRQTALATERERIEAELAQAIRSRDEAAAALATAEAHVEDSRDGLVKAREAEHAARHRLGTVETTLRELERERDRQELDRARRQDELGLVRERAARDLDTANVESLLSSLQPSERDDPAALEREIGRLRERLRRIGLAGDDAVEQYEREAERYGFLRRQLDDVHRASEALRALLAQLDRTMAEDFDRTFAEVAQAFESTFTALFGGGKARLVRQVEEGSSGVDIVAQPPGKRLQSLGLLSGGERALTAVALLFAILKVNPSPFCLLDEVDAALDEANVVRVRDELRQLARTTQFVVVTHNRATIEGADTLYGITMGDDGISRVLSLRLPAEATA